MLSLYYENNKNDHTISRCSLCGYEFCLWIGIIERRIITCSLMPTPPLTPSEPPECEDDRQAIKVALDACYTSNDQWPTADGTAGLIV